VISLLELENPLDFRKGKCCFATLSSTYLIFYFNHLHRIFYTTHFESSCIGREEFPGIPKVVP
ncbi:MAG: hypothetical protein WC209_16950, partial [Ignavibacteriaceae bacterium]